MGSQSDLGQTPPVPSPPGPDPVASDILAEMSAYYDARASEFDEWFARAGRYNRGAAVKKRWDAEVGEVVRILEATRIQGDVLELAGGTGIWTERLVNMAHSLTVVDASPAMIERNRRRLDDERVTYVVADLFDWRPARQYDAVAFCFWISHVPVERLTGFLATVADSLRPGGTVFCLDSRRTPESTAIDHELAPPNTQLTRRALNDGREYRVVKNFYEPDSLRGAFDAAGFDIEVKLTDSFFFVVTGQRR